LTTSRADLPMPLPAKDAIAYSLIFSFQSPSAFRSPLRPSDSRAGGHCGRLMSSEKPWGRCCNRSTLNMKPLKERYYQQLNISS
jgi:hypothetical protein